jgi:hypothetical protein
MNFEITRLNVMNSNESLHNVCTVETESLQLTHYGYGLLNN